MPPVDKTKSAATAAAEQAAAEKVAAEKVAAEKVAAEKVAAAAKSLARSVTLTAAEVAKAVKREVPVVDKDGKATGETKAVSVGVDEVFAWSLRGDAVTVVTTDGQKLVGSL